MQEGDGFFRGLARGAGHIINVDSRPLLLAFAACAGAAVYMTLTVEPPLEWQLVLLAGITGALLLSRRYLRSDILYAFVIIGFGLALGGTAAAVKTRLVEAPMVTAETRPVMLEGWVTGVELGRRNERLNIRVHSISGYAAEQLPRHVRLTHMSRLEVSPGRFVRCWAVLRPPPSPTLAGDYDFRRQAYFEKLGAVGYVQGRCRGGALGKPVDMRDQLTLWIAAKRRQLALHVEEMAGERAGGLAAALVTGDRSFVRPGDRDALRDTGLAHLLAISGLHLSVVGGMTYLIFRRTLALVEPLALRLPVQKLAAIAALVACALYLVVSGASVSTQRAFIMATIVFAAVIFDRSAISLRTFSVAMIAIVLLQPESVVTPGFQMSFAATGGLVAAYEVWRRHRAGRDRVLGPIGFAWASIIVTSVVSDAATSPYALFHFDRISPVGLMTNFVVMPVVTFVTAPIAALTVLLSIFGYGDVGLRWFGQSLELVLALTHFFNDLSPGIVRIPVPMPAAALVCLSLALALSMGVTGWARLVGAAVMTLPAIWLWANAPKIVLHWSGSGDVYIADERGYVSKLSLARGDGLPPLRFAQAGDLAPCRDLACKYTSLNRINIDVLMRARAGGEEETYQISLRSMDNNGTTMIIGWEDIQRDGGLTIYLKHGRLMAARVPQCSSRPWQRCAAAAPAISPEPASGRRHS